MPTVTRRTLVLAILAVGLAAAGYAWFSEDAAAVTSFRTAPVERGELAVEIAATGTLQPLTRVEVGTQISGTVAALYADFNSQVSQGQVVAQIDPASYEARVASDRANVARAEADVERVLALLRQADRELERYTELLSDDMVTVAEHESALANRDSLRAQVAVARASVVQQQATLAMSEVNLTYTTIVSPIDGIVISRDVDVGQTVAASLSAPLLFVIAADLERMQVEAAVAEADVGRLAAGQRVRFRVDAFPDQSFEGRVNQIRLAATTLQNVVTYTVLVDVVNPGGKLLPGMTANLQFEVEHVSDTLTVPDAALRYTPPESAAGGQVEDAADPRNGKRRDDAPAVAGSRPGRVWVADAAGPRAVDVSVGPSDGIRSAVDGPLQVGDQVIVGVQAAGSSGPAAVNPFAPPRSPVSRTGRPR